MENKKAIGFKQEWSILKSVLFCALGVIVIAIAICSFLFLISGAIGGAITGALIGGSIALITMSISVHKLPNEIVLIDDTTVYVNKRTVEIAQIKSVKSKGKGIIITTKQGKTVQQAFIKNAEECVQQILSKLS